ncbi:YggS family pyridoxal phosphate-dependent enzyme [Desulfofundulus sp. TPOSR]|uniref:YggS family pyridoxal phosphate-dependent enzyme n=1 Tax=Desulfofundulus sp. TPOSR TaxID=2714340 RepID=UPI00140E7318|nr:YggS family pyridoxal phosphate-dependent enzyme [Desulfofundulus sp. TPOSR]NHM25797.1 YggS family pyridoxal phosphate-dependent enzyme [Desulfofundulus sp. TPOSR]
MGVRENLSHVIEQMTKAAKKAGRDPGSVKLVAVTKNVSVDIMREALAAGINAFGENRVQELVAKHPQLPVDVEWHLIGHLQTNKVKYIIGKVHLIHSLDSWRLAREISRRAQERGLTVEVLVQVNISGEETKYGLPPGEVRSFVAGVAELPGIRVRGLMTIAPLVSDPEQARPIFRELYQMASWLKQELPELPLDFLSMGMSNDFTVAVEEGANIIRVGSAIFGPRPNPRRDNHGEKIGG